MSISAEAGDRNLIVVTEENFLASIEKVIELLSTGDGVECDCQGLTDERQQQFHEACSARIKTLANGKEIHTITVGSEEELEEVSRQIMAAGGPNLSDILRRKRGLGQSGGAMNLDSQVNAAPTLDELAMARQRKQMSLEVRAYLLADCDFTQVPFSTVLTIDNYAEMIDRAITALTSRRPVLVGLGLLPQALRDEVDEDMHAAARQAEGSLLTNRFMATNDGRIIIDDELVEPGDISAALSRSLTRNFGAAAIAASGLHPSLKQTAEVTEKLAAMRRDQDVAGEVETHAEAVDRVYAENREARLDAAEAEIAHQITTDLAMKSAMAAAAFLTLLEYDPEAARDRDQIESMFGDILEAAVQSVSQIQDAHELEFPATAVIEYGHARDLDKLDDNQLDHLLSAQDVVLQSFTQGTDAALWASAFLITMERSQESIIIDTSFLLGWFANAIEAGRTAGKDQVRKQEVQKAYEEGIKRGLFLAKVQTVANDLGDGGTKASPLNTSPTGDAPLAGGSAPVEEKTPEPVAAG